MAVKSVTTSVNGVVYFYGLFAHYYKGISLCSTDERTLDMTVSQREDNTIIVSNTSTGERKRFTLSNLKIKKDDKYIGFLKLVLSNLEKQGISFERGFDIVIKGSLLNSNRTMQTTSICVCFLKAIRAFTTVDIPDQKITEIVFNVCSPSDMIHCNYSLVASLVKGQIGRLILFDEANYTCSIVDDIFKDSEYALILANPGCSSHEIDEEVEELTDRVINLMQKFGRIFKKNGFKNTSSFDVISSDDLTSFEKKIIQSLMEEHKIEMQFELAIKNRDFEVIGNLIRKANTILSYYLDISCPETDWLIKRANETDLCLGAGSVYSMEGLFVVALVRRDGFGELQVKAEEYEKIFGYKGRIRVFSPHNYT